MRAAIPSRRRLRRSGIQFLSLGFGVMVLPMTAAAQMFCSTFRKTGVVFKRVCMTLADVQLAQPVIIVHLWGRSATIKSTTCAMLDSTVSKVQVDLSQPMILQALDAQLVATV